MSSKSGKSWKSLKRSRESVLPRSIRRTSENSTNPIDSQGDIKKIVQSFIFSNCEYCPLVWYFSSSKSLQKIEKLHERALRFLYNDHTSSYNDLLSKSDRWTMLISRQRVLCIEIVKTVNKLNPPHMRSVNAKTFHLRTSCYSLRNPNDLAHIRPNQATFGRN